jgi:hypothetical protein
VQSRDPTTGVNRPGRGLATVGDPDSTVRGRHGVLRVPGTATVGGVHDSVGEGCDPSGDVVIECADHPALACAGEAGGDRTGDAGEVVCLQQARAAVRCDRDRDRDRCGRIGLARRARIKERGTPGIDGAESARA